MNKPRGKYIWVDGLTWVFLHIHGYPLKSKTRKHRKKSHGLQLKMLARKWKLCIWKGSQMTELTDHGPAWHEHRRKQRHHHIKSEGVTTGRAGEQPVNSQYLSRITMQTKTGKKVVQDVIRRTWRVIWAKDKLQRNT